MLSYLYSKCQYLPSFRKSFESMPCLAGVVTLVVIFVLGKRMQLEFHILVDQANDNYE